MGNSPIWPSVQLKQITTKIGSGATPRGGKESYKANGITLIRSLNVYDFTFAYDGLARIDEKQAGELDNVVVEPNDILLNITGASVARCCIVPKNVLPARVNQHVAIVRIATEIADARFVLYVINSPYYKQYLLTIAQGGATREALTKEKIETFEIPLPSLIIQQKIASILSAYDDLIENNTCRIRILEEMAQTIYREWFVHFRFPGHEGVRMVELPMGLIPEGWEVRNLFNVAEITYGYPFNSSFFSNKPEGMQVIRIRDIPNNSTSTYTTESAIKNKYKVNQGDILIGMDGNFHMCKWAGGEAWLNQRVTRLRTKPNSIPQYLLFLLIQPKIRELNATIVGTTVAHLGDNHLREIFLITPSDSINRMCHKIYDPILRSEIILRQKNSILRAQRDLLLPRLVSGELDVEKLMPEISESI